MYPISKSSTRWLLVPILAIATIIAILIGLGLYFASKGISPVAVPFYWFPFPFFPLIFIPIIILIFFGLRFSLWGCLWGRGWSYYDPAFMALRERFARGEITKDQYEEIARSLEQRSA